MSEDKKPVAHEDEVAQPNPPQRVVWDDLFRMEIADESDRAAVILSAAFLDSALEYLLRTHLLPCATSSDPLFDGVNAPFSDFSARIDVAFRLGLIDTAFARSLHLIRRIRNDFAHNISGCTFQDSSVMARMTELARCTDLPKGAGPRVRARFREGLRGQFEMTVSYLQWLLHAEAELQQPIDGAAAMTGAHSSESEGSS